MRTSVFASSVAVASGILMLASSAQAAIVSANLPKSCGQLGEVQLKRDGNTFFVRLIAELPAQTDCNNDALPFRLEIPLNIVNLPEGTYEVNVNGVVTTFEIPVQ